jgi:hypothetical protein
MTGNLGVGGAANGSYAITSHSSGGANLRLENDGEVGFIRLEDDGDLNIWAHGDENIGFMNGTGSGTTQMNIDGSGRVTKPSQPAFFARHTTASAYNNQYVDAWNSITFNIGNHFVGSTGIFTAPVAGIYQLNAMIGNNYAQGDGAYKIYKNNTLVNGFTFDPFSNQTTWSTNVLCGTVQCAANDTVRIYCSGAGYPDNADWTSWSMYLLG